MHKYSCCCLFVFFLQRIFERHFGAVLTALLSVFIFSVVCCFAPTATANSSHAKTYLASKEKAIDSDSNFQVGAREEP